MTAALPAMSAGLVLSLSLIMAIGPQNLHVLRVGLQRRHLGLTVAVCIVADVVLIAVGVLGLGRLGGLAPQLHGALVGAGAVFLAGYGWQAWRRFRAPAATTAAGPGAALPAAPVAALTRRQAVLSALAFSWLNPHAWVDTAVLIGTASLAYGPMGASFGVGAAAGSALWFLALGGAVLWLGQRLDSLRLWRALDGIVAIMMWGTAAGLLASLF